MNCSHGGKLNPCMEIIHFGIGLKIENTQKHKRKNKENNRKIEHENMKIAYNTYNPLWNNPSRVCHFRRKKNTVEIYVKFRGKLNLIDKLSP